jgi:hypothetical protein
MSSSQVKTSFLSAILLSALIIPFQNCAKQGSAGEVADGSHDGTDHNHSAGTEVPVMESFAILPATGSGAWNAMTSPMVVYVGQTLRITNNDTVNHQLHTGGKPCPHQSNAAAPGGFYDCVISAETTGTATMKDYSLYDHALGTASKFYVRVYDGPRLYDQKCASCHGALASSAVKGGTVSTISWAQQNVSQMAGVTLTAEEREALEIALKY